MAFQTFGGGATLCPGCHFVTTKILATATILIARFDLKPVGCWPEPNRTNPKLRAPILELPHDFEVDVSEIEGWKEHKWRIGFGEGSSVLAMAAEDSN